jgi:hypothetical protein
VTLHFFLFLFFVSMKEFLPKMIFKILTLHSKNKNCFNINLKYFALKYYNSLIINFHKKIRWSILVSARLQLMRYITRWLLLFMGFKMKGYVSTKDQLVDLLTKSLSHSRFQLLCSKIGVTNGTLFLLNNAIT